MTIKFLQKIITLCENIIMKKVKRKQYIVKSNLIKKSKQTIKFYRFISNILLKTLNIDFLKYFVKRLLNHLNVNLEIDEEIKNYLLKILHG